MKPKLISMYAAIIGAITSLATAADDLEYRMITRAKAKTSEHTGIGFLTEDRWLDNHYLAKMQAFVEFNYGPFNISPTFSRQTANDNTQDIYSLVLSASQKLGPVKGLCAIETKYYEGDEETQVGPFLKAGIDWRVSPYLADLTIWGVDGKLVEHRPSVGLGISVNGWFDMVVDAAYRDIQQAEGRFMVTGALKAKF